MKNTQEVVVFIRKTAETVVDRVNHQVKQIVRLVTKQPKKPPLSWESIIGDLPGKSHRSAIVKSSKRLELPEVNQQLVQLPQETFDELLGQIQMNTLDEIKAIRLYEKLFDCEIRILRGHVHFYKCKRHKKEETIDYTTLTGRLLQLFIEHKEIISDASGVRY